MSLTYFDDAEVQPMPFMFDSIRWEQMKQEIIKAVEKISPVINKQRHNYLLGRSPFCRYFCLKDNIDFVFYKEKLQKYDILM